MRLTLMAIGISIMAATVTLAAPGEQLSLEIEFDKHSCRLHVTGPGESATVEFELAEVRQTDRQLFVGTELLADEIGFHVGQYLLPYDELQVRRVRVPRETYSILLEPKDSQENTRRRRGGDQLIAFESAVVEERDFLRGDVLLIGDELQIEGEVNGNVILFFGNVRLSRTAICRKDVLVIGGEIERHSAARVYGEIQSTRNWRYPRPPGSDDDERKNAVDLHATGEYNRVDGVVLEVGIGFHSEEEFMPEFFIDYGYGFWSQRSKYRLGLRHDLFDYYQLSFGGQVYRWTTTEDDWRCGRGENTLYALIAREDFRDYYQGEGGSIFLEQKLTYDHTLRLDYKFEELDFMPANPNLWSLFGGDKKFRGNFSSVDSDYLAEHLPDYTKDEATLRLGYTYDTSADRFGELLRSGWFAELAFEHSSKALGSDFDYDRLLIELRRYQPLTYRQNLNLRLRYGSATGELPLHKHFYLGGIRTLRAFDIKEFSGTHMALANLEYVLDFPNTDIGVVVLFDLGKTGWESDFLAEGGWLADVGVGFSVGDIRAEFTRPINGDTNKIQFSILIGRSF